MRLVLFLFSLLAFAPAYAQATFFSAPAGGVSLLKIASNTDAYAITPLIRGFQDVYSDIDVEYTELSSNALYAMALQNCEAQVWFADLVISSSMAQQFKLVNDGCARDLDDAELVREMERLPDWAKWSGELVGLTYEPAAIVVNRDAFVDAPPNSHAELIEWLKDNPDAMGRVGSYDIEQSGVGYLFAYADTTFSQSSLRLQIFLQEVQTQYFASSSQIIDLVAEGRLDLGYNVLGSYALYRAERDPRLRVIFLEDFTPVLSRSAYISREAKNDEAARAFLKFTLSPMGQNILAGGSRLMSSRSGASQISELMDAQFSSFHPIPLDPSLLIVMQNQMR